MGDLRGHGDSVTCVRAWTDEMLLSASYDATVRQGRRAARAGDGEASRTAGVVPWRARRRGLARHPIHQGQRVQWMRMHASGPARGMQRRAAAGRGLRRAVEQSRGKEAKRARLLRGEKQRAGRMP